MNFGGGGYNFLGQLIRIHGDSSSGMVVRKFWVSAIQQVDTRTTCNVQVSNFLLEVVFQK
jgi:hypothetical protein